MRERQKKIKRNLGYLDTHTTCHSLEKLGHTYTGPSSHPSAPWPWSAAKLACLLFASCMYPSCSLRPTARTPSWGVLLLGQWSFLHVHPRYCTCVHGPEALVWMHVYICFDWQG